jgi:hypothetical protein
VGSPRKCIRSSLLVLGSTLVSSCHTETGIFEVSRSVGGIGGENMDGLPYEQPERRFSVMSKLVKPRKRLEVVDIDFGFIKQAEDLILVYRRLRGLLEASS